PVRGNASRAHPTPRAGLKAERMLDPADSLRVRFVPLPKAKRVTIQPLTSDFLDIDDQEAFLTNGLRSNFTTLQRGQMLTLWHEGKEYQMVVQELEPSSAPACIIINTDCAVTTMPPMDAEAGAGGDTSRKATQRARVGEEVTGSLVAGGVVYVALVLPPDQDPTTAKPVLSFAKTGGDAGAHADIFVSLAPVKKPTLVQHTWYASSLVHERVELTAESANLSDAELALQVAAAATAVEALSFVELPRGGPTAPTVALSRGDTVYVGVTAVRGALDFRLTLQLVPAGMAVDATTVPALEASAPAPAAGAGADAASSSGSGPIPAGGAAAGFRAFAGTPLTMAGADATGASPAPPPPADPTRKMCPHCGASVPAGNFALHVPVCARNNVRCTHPGCGAVLRKGSDAAAAHVHCGVCSAILPPALMAKHVDLFHAEHTCECGVSLPLPALREHYLLACPRRFVVCRFCGDTTRAGPPPADHAARLAGLTTHEDFCGSRSVQCPTCALRLPRKQLHMHMAAAHAFDGPPVLTHLTSELPPSRPASTGGRDSGEDVETSDANWQCPACSTTNLPFETACSACGGARPPPTLRRERRSSDMDTDSSHEGGSVDEGDGEEWACATCTLLNPGSDMTCTACGARRPDADRIQASRARSALSRRGYFPGPGSTAAPALCSNQVCANFAARTGDAARFRLCTRCHNMFAEDVHSGDQLQGQLVELYSAQLAVGCGNDACRNPYCCSGRVNIAAAPPSGVDGALPSPSPASAPSMSRAGSTSDLAGLIEAAGEIMGAGRYYVCVLDHQRPHIVPLQSRYVGISGGSLLPSAAPAVASAPADVAPLVAPAVDAVSAAARARSGSGSSRGTPSARGGRGGSIASAFFK
ncbi:MAG: hypothetical protein EOO41_00845, partial [Methanobacteriota archaeon]